MEFWVDHLNNMNYGFGNLNKIYSVKIFYRIKANFEVNELFVAESKIYPGDNPFTI